MAIIRRTEKTPSRNAEFDPFQLMDSMLRGFDPFRQMVPFYAEERGFVPQFEVKETKDGYHFKADVPGVKEADLDISLHGNMLTITGKREAEKKEEGETWYAYERTFGSFTRSFTLPEGADAEHVKADLKDGVLMLTLPKKPEMQAKKIPLGQAKGKINA